MILFDWSALIALGVILVVLLLAVVLERQWPTTFRRLATFEVLKTEIDRSIETGERVHISLGTGSLVGVDSAAAFAGLAVLARAAASSLQSDKPLVVTAGDGALAILAQDTLRAAYDLGGVSRLYDPTSGRLLAPTAFSYSAAVPMVLATEQVSAHMLIGAYGAEGALVAEFGQQQGIPVFGGTADVQSQALLYAIADYPLVGEEVYAGGAYLDGGVVQRGGLRAQDGVRILIIAAIVIGTVLQTLGIWP